MRNPHCFEPILLLSAYNIYYIIADLAVQRADVLAKAGKSEEAIKVLEATKVLEVASRIIAQGRDDLQRVLTLNQAQELLKKVKKAEACKLIQGILRKQKIEVGKLSNILPYYINIYKDAKMTKECPVPSIHISKRSVTDFIRSYAIRWLSFSQNQMRTMVMINMLNVLAINT